MANAELTTADVAARMGRPERTVRLWCKQGRFDGARAVSTPRGDYWVIPESALKNFQEPERGRPAANPKSNSTGASKKQSALPATPKFGSIELQTRTTRRLDPKVGRAAEKKMGGKKGGGK